MQSCERNYHNKSIKNNHSIFSKKMCSLHEIGLGFEKIMNFEPSGRLVTQ